MYRKCWHCTREVRVREKILDGLVVETYVVHFILGEKCPASLTRPTDGDM
jgi:hypothetical protein